MLVTCKICKSKIDRNIAYNVRINNKNNYYCTELEYKKMLSDKENRLSVLEISYEIIGRTTNTILLKEIKEIAKIHTYGKLLKYLQNNIDDLNKIMTKNFTNEFGKIKYYTTIIKNQIGDFHFKEQDTEIYNVDIIENAVYTSTKKKSFSEFIDEY